MNLFGVMDISGSALKAERLRAEVTASNMANAETTRAADGKPYKRQEVLFQSNDTTSFRNILQGQPGVQFASMGTPNEANAVEGGVSVAGVVSDESAPLTRYEPGHPDADANGFVAYPNINPVTEMVDLVGASRAYGANATALQAEKGMVSASLDLLK